VNLPEGYAARPAVREDLEDVVALMDAWDMLHFGEANSNREGLQYTWGSPWVDLARDARVILTTDRMLAAYVRHSSPDPAARYETEAFVHPAHQGRGLGSAITAWAEAKTRSLLAPGAGLPLWDATSATDVEGLRLLETNGYAHIRTFFQMLMDLDETFEAGDEPADVSIRSFRPGDERGAHETMDEAFSTHFGYVSEPFEQWWEHQSADESFDPALGFVADVDGQIVGASINGVIDGTGWIYELGVRHAWQAKGIGRALVRHSFAMFAADGIGVARLGVDTENVKGALELYRSVGMREVREWRVFEKRIEAD
jgi:ribosomal protein S18 acetylase RimI-like enzyme